MAAHQAAAPKRKRDTRDLKTILPACLAPPKAVQSDFVDLADETAVDPHAAAVAAAGSPRQMSGVCSSNARMNYRICRISV